MLEALCARISQLCCRVLHTFSSTISIGNTGKTEVEVGKGVKKNPTQIWPYLCGILFNSFPGPNYPLLRDRYVYSKWFTILKEVGTSEVRVLTFGLSPVIKLSIRHPRKKERKQTNKQIFYWQCTKQRPNHQDPGAVAAAKTRERDRDTFGAFAWVLALHVPFVRTCFAPACTYLALVCAFFSLFILKDNTCLRARVLSLRAPFVRVRPTPACACLPCVCACALSCIRSTCSIAVSFPTP